MQQKKMRNNGIEFEATLAKSWVASNLPLIRIKLTETGEERPCDERVDLKNLRLFNELKSTKHDYFNIRQLKPHQLQSLMTLHKKFSNVVSLVFIEFMNENIVKVIDIFSLVTFIKKGQKSAIKVTDNIGYNLVRKGDIYLITQEFVNYLESI